MFRAVLDANVVVSAFLRSGGPSGKILRRFLEEQSFELVLREDILDELRRALQYPRVRKYLRLSDEQTEARVASLGILADLAAGDVEVQAVSADPDDDKYLAAALEGRADFIVTGDRHLQEMAEYQGVRILSPREFLEILDTLPPTSS